MWGHGGVDDMGAGDVDDRRGARPRRRRPERRQLRVPSAKDSVGGDRLGVGFEAVDGDAGGRQADAGKAADEAFGMSLESLAQCLLTARSNYCDPSEEDISGREEAQAFVMVVVVIPAEEVVAPATTVLRIGNRLT